MLFAEIIAIGTELLTPFKQDTNSLFLTGRLNELGVEVRFKTVVGDRREDLISAAKLAFDRTDVIIFMGGLGPTEDDLTRECVAAALSRELHRDPDIIAALYARFAERRLKMSANNERQADVIAGAEVLPNANGTAPGQFLRVPSRDWEKFIILLPGPPRELKPLFDEQVRERLRHFLPPFHIATSVLKVAMIGEGQLDARIAPIYTKHKEVETTILASPPGEVQIHLRARAESQPEAAARVSALSEELEEELGDAVFSREGESLEQIVGLFLQMRGATLAVAESCTGGLIAQRLTRIGGSSRFFLGGAVVYSNELKTAFADVPARLIAQHGAVSDAVARALAEGIRTRCGATYGIGVTGIAGPAGGSDEKPVGLVFHALADGSDTQVIERRFFGDRERVRWFAAQQALDMLRRKLME
jgi:nicotinamide-nucleotide amidase